MQQKVTQLEKERFATHSLVDTDAYEELQIQVSLQLLTTNPTKIQNIFARRLI